MATSYAEVTEEQQIDFPPRPLLRMIPGKLRGEPHLVGTRIASAVVFEFSWIGYPLSDIQEFYPDADPTALERAIEFERTLLTAAQPLDRLVRAIS